MTAEETPKKQRVSELAGLRRLLTPRVAQPDEAESKRQQVEAALRESESRRRSLTEDSPDHVVVLDTDLSIQFGNYPLPGLTAEVLAGTPPCAYAPEERQSEIKDILENVLRTGEPACHETQYDAPDGGTSYYESRVVPRRELNRVRGLTVHARDITDRRQRRPWGRVKSNLD